MPIVGVAVKKMVEFSVNNQVVVYESRVSGNNFMGEGKD